MLQSERVRPVYVVMEHGIAVDTISVPTNEECLPDDPHFSSGMWQDFRALAFPKLKWAAGPTGDVVYGCPARYEYDRRRVDGTVVRVIQEGHRATMTGDERKSFVEEWENTPQHRRLGWRWKGPRPPATRPAYQALFISRDGRVWVWKGQVREKVIDGTMTGWVDQATGSFDVYEEDGRYLGAVALPGDVRFRWYVGPLWPYMAGDTIWAVRTDDLDRPYVSKLLVRWRRRPSEGNIR